MTDDTASYLNQIGTFLTEQLEQTVDPILDETTGNVAQLRRALGDYAPDDGDQQGDIQRALDIVAIHVGQVREDIDALPDTLTRIPATRREAGSTMVEIYQQTVVTSADDLVTAAEKMLDTVADVYDDYMNDTHRMFTDMASTIRYIAMRAPGMVRLVMLSAIDECF